MGVAELDHRRHEELRARLASELRRDLVEACEECNGSGWLLELDEELGVLGVGSSKACSCRHRMRELLALYEAGVPRELWNADTIEPEHNESAFEVCHRYAETLREQAREGLGLFLYGENGTGKSSSACVCAIAAIRLRKSAAYVDFRDLVQGWRRGWRDAELRAHLDGRLMRDFVVLDEIGKEHVGNDGEGFILSGLDSVLRMRRGEYLPTVLVSNLEPSVFFDRYGKSIESLMADRFRFVPYKPGDFRLKSKSWSTLIRGGRGEQ